MDAIGYVFDTRIHSQGEIVHRDGSFVWCLTARQHIRKVNLCQLWEDEIDSDCKGWPTRHNA